MRNALAALLPKRRTSRRRGVSAPGFPTMNGLHYHKVLTAIEDRIRPEWYLEIGSRSGTSISHRRCNFIAIDPEFAITAPVFNSARQMHFFQMTSDDFFGEGHLGKMGIVPDLAFIDGMHLFEFALRDFMNAEATMQPNGIICFHDVCPYDHPMTTRDLNSSEAPGAWTGDVWKTIAILKELRPDLQIDVLSAHSTGLACVTRLDSQSTVLRDAYDGVVRRYVDVTLAEFGVGHYYDLVGLTDPGDYLIRLEQSASVR